jgi:type II secretory pathway pseudopilin PulG
MNQPSNHRPSNRRSAFTLLEAMVAVGILLVVILFTSQIFSSASRVTSTGQANADAMQEAAAIEQQVRADFERLSRDGFLAIVSAAVRNDVNDASSNDPRLWLNPDLPFDAFIRCDRIVFFTQGMSSTQVFNPSGSNFGINRKPQAAASRVYYGHGFQLGDKAGGLTDVEAAIGDVSPWARGSVNLVNWPSGTSAGSLNLLQPEARLWSLARHNVLLGDDGGGTGSYLNQGLSAATIWDFAACRDSRVDIVASQLNDVRDRVLNVDANGVAQNRWTDMRDSILNAIYFPRAEKVATSTFREDHATTVGVLGGSASDFVVEWTWDEGVGRAANPLNATAPYEGVGEDWNAGTQRFDGVMRAGEQTWFGLPDDEVLAQSPTSFSARNVYMYSDLSNQLRADAIDPAWIESIDTSTSRVIRYAAVFGYNQSRPLNPETKQPWVTGAAGVPAYTPWPSALRFTVRLHDANTRLTSGRVLQFVVNLPK